MLGTVLSGYSLRATFHESESGKVYFCRPSPIPDAEIMTVAFGRPDSEPSDSMCLTTSMPSTTSPKTTCLPSNHDVTTVVIKNYTRAEPH